MLTILLLQLQLVSNDINLTMHQNQNILYEICFDFTPKYNVVHGPPCSIRLHIFSSKHACLMGQSMVGVLKRIVPFYIHWTLSFKHIIET